MGGKRIVLVASDTESTEYQRNTWRQMIMATVPARYAGVLHVDINTYTETLPDGQAKFVPHGLRVVEALLLERFPAADVAVCYPEQMDRFIGEDTRAVGVHAHNPLGIAFAAGVYAHFYGAEVEPVNANDFRRIMQHPALRAHKPHLKLIVGGPGTWQIEHKQLQDAWEIDCLVHGESEAIVADLFAAAVEGRPLPRRAEGQSPALGSIPNIRHRSTYGAVEITRGCGRGCQFCSIALRRGKSLPLEHILADVRAHVAEGADTILLVTEDLFLYEQGPKFATNIPALERLLAAIAAVPGVKHVMVSHGTMSPVVLTPQVIDALSPVAVGRSVNQHPLSTHPDHRYAMLFIGLETGSPRLFDLYMKGKSYPFRPRQWPDVVLKGMEILNRQNWFPFCTWIIGLPEETDADMRQSLDLLYALKDAKWAAIPTLFVPLDGTRMSRRKGAKLFDLTDLQWEFFYTCWRYNIDFYSHRVRNWKYMVGIPIYYYLLGRRLFGRSMKYAAFRTAHFPEWWLRRHLYLDFTGRSRPKLEVPESVPVPSHGSSPRLELAELS